MAGSFIGALYLRAQKSGKKDRVGMRGAFICIIIDVTKIGEVRMARRKVRGRRAGKGTMRRGRDAGMQGEEKWGR